MNRLLVCVALLTSMSADTTSRAAAAAEAPKLVVVVVVDQTRRSEIDRLEPHFTGGFRRLFNEGARLDGHYGQQNTYTGPGHALILSGSYGYLNGIFQNAWFNRATGRSESMLFDETVQVINQGTVSPGEDSSPRNFYGSTVGDELRMSNGGKSRVVALAIKERGALLLGGRTGTAYFFNDLNGEWTTSTYYMNALPDWLVAFNAKRLPDQWFGKEWTRCLPEAVYGPEPDDAPWEADQLGLGRTFPHKITGGEQKPTGKYWQAFTNSPFGIDHTFEFACAAVEGEGLGRDEITDVLAISVSPTDFLGHAYGTYSHEVRDSFLRTDRALGEFFTYLDKRLGQRGWIALVTADHGSAQPPERARPLGLSSQRVRKAAIKTAINAALGARFGAGDWVLALEDPSVYLNRKLIEERKLEAAAVEAAAGEAVMTLSGFLGYATRTQILHGNLPPVAASRAIARSFFAPRAGDVVLVQAPFSFWGKSGEWEFGSGHGSFYRYDTDVPVFFLGAPFAAGYFGETEMVDLAATLARLLNINQPAACEGQPIGEILAAPTAGPGVSTSAPSLRRRND
jgi:predicted AlkP superfamily pyrophosphatase or phosphodiesterase